MRRLLSVAVALCVVIVLAPGPCVGDGSAAPGALLRTLTGHTEAVASVAVTPDGSQVVSGSDDQTLKVWDLNTGARLRTLAGHDNEVFLPCPQERYQLLG